MSETPETRSLTDRLRRVWFPYDNGPANKPPVRPKPETWPELAKRLWPDDDLPNW